MGQLSNLRITKDDDKILELSISKGLSITSYILIFFGILFLLFFLPSLLTNIWNDVSIVFGVIGTIFLYIGIFIRITKSKNKIIFSSDEEEIKFVGKQNKSSFNIKFSDISHFNIHKEIKRKPSQDKLINLDRVSSRKMRSYIVYIVNAIKLDGSIFYIDSSSNDSYIIELVNKIIKHSKLEVRDKSGLDLSSTAKKQYINKKRNIISNDNPNVKIIETLSDTEIMLNKTINISAIILIYIFLIGFLIITYVFSQIDTNISVVHLIIGSLLTFAILSITFLIIFYKRKIFLGSDKIRIVTYFFNPNKEGKIIPKNSIAQIRVNRNNDGYFSLSVAQKKGQEIFPKNKFLRFAMMQTLVEGFLFEIPLFKVEQNSKKIGIDDLYYLEWLITRKLNLIEDKLSDNNVLN